eukprot:5537352-Pyramimonas_sp.AAC.1
MGAGTSQVSVFEVSGNSVSKWRSKLPSLVSDLSNAAQPRTLGTSVVANLHIAHESFAQRCP